MDFEGIKAFYFIEETSSFNSESLLPVSAYCSCFRKVSCLTFSADFPLLSVDRVRIVLILWTDDSVFLPVFSTLLSTPPVFCGKLNWLLYTFIAKSVFSVEVT